MSFAYKVEVEGTTGFILDTDKLDTGLLGYLTSDITPYVLSVSCKRGKSSQLDRFTAGQMTVVFDNRSRIFEQGGSGVGPRRIIKFYAGYDQNSLHSQFVGFIDDVTYNYDVSGESTATAACSDAFTVLAQQTITLTSPTAEISDARIQRVLTNSQVAWPLDEFFSQGAAFTMNNVSYTGNALDYILQVADSEQGLVYVNRSGVLTFIGWNYFTQDLIAGYTPDLLFSDDSYVPGYPFTNIETSYNTDQLYNSVTVTGSAGTVTSQDYASQASYRVAAYDLDVLTNGTAQMARVADSLLASYAYPVFRVTSLEVALDGYPQFYSPSVSSGSAAVSTVFQADFGYVTQVIWTPNGTGDPIGLFDYGILIGKTINASPAGCTVSFEVGAYVHRDAV